MAKIEGQIWIDKNKPYSLKYHTHDKDYTVQVAQSYNGSQVAAGSVLTLNPSNGYVTAAEFPKDAENVVGIAFNSTTDLAQVTVSRTGYLVLTGSELTNAFYSGDLNTSFNNFTAQNAIGAPVYWFIGRTTGANYTHVDSHTNKGKLTFATPTGMKNVTTVSDNSMNVGYDNLPQIGTIASITITSGVVTSLEVHVNISSFSTVLNWSWPYIHTSDAATDGYVAGTTTREGTTVAIHHGLFMDNYVNDSQKSKQIGVATIRAVDDISTSDIASMAIDTEITNATSGTTSRGTTIHLNTPENLYYKVIGTVNYKIDKFHN